jgi:hypothetical protein
MRSPYCTEVLFERIHKILPNTSTIFVSRGELLWFGVHTWANKAKFDRFLLSTVWNFIERRCSCAECIMR